MAFKHRKKRNTGLVYELLVRRMAKQLLDEDRDGYVRSVDILRRFFAEGSPLDGERRLFEAVRSARGCSLESAKRIVGELQRSAAGLDRKRIDSRKTALIGDLNRSFGKGFFSSHKVPEYRLLASIQLLVDHAAPGGELMETVERVQLEEAVARYLTAAGDVAPEPTAAAPAERIDSLACGLAARKFQERYGRALSPGQKKILDRFVRAEISGDGSRLVEFLAEERERILFCMKRAESMREVREDQVMRERLADAHRRLQSTDPRPDAATVEEMMLFSRLAEEISSDE